MLIELRAYKDRILAHAVDANGQRGRGVIASRETIEGALELLALLGFGSRERPGQLDLLQLQKPEPVIVAGIDGGLVVSENSPDYGFPEAEPVSSCRDSGTTRVARIVGDFDDESVGRTATQDKPV